MPRFYVEAYDRDGKQVLGNLDGQTVINCQDFRRSARFKALTSGKFRASERVVQWRIVDENDRVLHIINRR